MKAKLKTFNEIFSWVLLIAVTVMLIFSVYTVTQAKKTGEGAFVFGYRPVLVLTGSMEPYMMTNGLALTKEVTALNQIEVGDVITYHHDTEDGRRLLITHRIVGIEDGYIFTKGDNNRVSDSIPLTMENVEAKVISVFNQTAWLVAKWQTTSGKIMLISCAAAIILIYISMKIWLSLLFNQRNVLKGKNELAVPNTEVIGTAVPVKPQPASEATEINSNDE